MDLQINTPRWSLPLLNPCRYKGAKGGRGSGKSHFFVEKLIEAFVLNPNTRAVCIREIQKSLKYSAKSLIENKIQTLGVGHLFDITQTEIRTTVGDGLIIFQGMQDHTADSIKSLEGFDVAWVEEAQSLSQRSLELLRPTIRKNGSEIWFSWNPEHKTDAVDQFMLAGQHNERFCLVHVNYSDNPWLPDELKQEMAYDRVHTPDSFGHVWLGEYNEKSHAQIFKDKWVIDEFEAQAHWDGPYHGLDFGFAQDPTAGVRCWVADNRLWIDYEAGKVGLELDATAEHLSVIPDVDKHVIRADSARPESISYLKRHGLPRVTAVTKGKGSVEDGIEHIKSYEAVVIHPRCQKTADEFRLYSYKIDKRSGDILPVISDGHNHYIDALRYAIAPLISQKQSATQRPIGFI